MIEEGKKNRRPAQAEPTPAQPTATSANTQFAFSKMFAETSQRHFQNPAVEARFRDFLAHKTSNAMTPFGKKDYPLGEGPLAGILHAGLTSDVSVFYEIRGRNPHIMYLYFIATHDESGTVGGGKRLNVQRSWADRVAASRKTEFNIENLDPDLQ